jgi:hypothetical protein
MTQYTFHVAASGFGIVEPPLGEGTLEHGRDLVHGLGKAYAEWESRGCPEENGLHTVWEGCDISAHPVGGGEVLFYSDDLDDWESLA